MSCRCSQTSLRPTARHPSVAFVYVAVCVLLAGCTAANDISPAAQRIQSTRSFGDDNRMSITVEPGRIRELYEADRAAWVTAVHSSAPFGSVTIENGNFSEQRVLVEAGNYDTTAAVVPRIRALSAGARRDSRCDQPPFTTLPETLLAPLPLEVVIVVPDSPDGLRIDCEFVYRYFNSARLQL